MNISSVVARPFGYLRAHKFVTFIVLALLAGGGYWAYTTYAADDGETRYVLGTVKKGTIVSTITASGQVAASNQIEVTAKASGDLVSLNVKAGQAVRAGALLGSIDATDAAFELENARLSYDELLATDPQDILDAEADLTRAYTDARTTLISLSSSLPDTLDTIDELFDGYLAYETGRTKTEITYVTTAEKSYRDAKDSIGDFQTSYRKLSNTTKETEILALLESALKASGSVLQGAKDAKDAVVYIKEESDSSNSSALAEAVSASATASEAVASASAAVSDAADARDAITDASTALADLKEGPDTLDIRSEELTIRQKQQTYEDHFIRAPFDGIIAAVPVSRGDSLNSGATVATLITQQMIAELSLNEVDAAKIAIGDKATLTFDALEELTLTGSVAEVDLVGTVSQGVVSYTVKIAFDSDDEQVKPGMTANAAIITDTKQDVLVVPASAVKTQNGESYVLAFQPELTESGGTQGVASAIAPIQIPVTIGISDDTSVEILSGLSEGAQVVTRTISGSATPAASTQSGFGGPGGGGGIRL